MAIGPYPAVFEAAEGDEVGYTVTFRDLPEAITEGDTEEDALRMAEDVLASALSYYAEQGKPLPRPSEPKRGERLVFLPTLIQAKLALWIRMGELGMTKADLADKLGVDYKAARRLMKLDKRSPAMAQAATKAPSSQPSPISADTAGVVRSAATMPRIVLDTPNSGWPSVSVKPPSSGQSSAVPIAFFEKSGAALATAIRTRS